MEETQPGKRSRLVVNGGCYELAKVRAPSKEEGEEVGRGPVGLLPWHNPASRICRVSRASGGKDRHSKVLTAKGLRDRRVRLSVSTAIQFYDLQDRLGYDQPSKAVEWLIKAASAAISELPSLDGAFAELSNRLARRAEEENFDVRHQQIDHQPHNQQQQNQHLSLTKSTCSSTSETSKGSVLSLSRSDSRVKAREKAKERAARESGDGRCDDRDADAGGSSQHHQTGGRNPTSQCSFTDLLTGSNCQEDNMVTVAQANSTVVPLSHSFIHKHMRNLTPAVTADYFGQAQKASHLPGIPANFLGSSPPIGNLPFGFMPAPGDGEHGEIQQQQQHHFPFMQEHLIPITAVPCSGGGDYNLNFSISSGLTGLNRGTLQSNSPSMMTHIHHLQRMPSQADGSNLPFFFGGVHPAASTPGENPFNHGIDGRLQIYYGDDYRNSDLKGKGKN